MDRKNWFFLGIYCIFMAGVALPASGSAAVKAKLGQSCALTGQTAFLGTEMNKGAKAYFDNHAADDVILVSKDDGYEPERCRINTEAFIQDGVDALFGYVGTPTARAALPLSTEKKTIFFGAFTGADFLSDTEKNPYSFALRASYDTEIENMMRHLQDDLRIRRVSLFVQRDDFGLAGIAAAVRAEKILDGIRIIPPVPPVPGEEASAEEWRSFWNMVPHYRRNTVSVGGGVRQVRGNVAEAVILVGTARPCALAINQWHKMKFKVPMMNVSFVGSVALAKRLKDTENVYISQVVPDPWNLDLPIVQQYHKDIPSDQYGFVTLEGYITANIMHYAFNRIDGTVNTDSIKKSLESISEYDAGGIKVTFGPDDHRGMDKVYLTDIKKEGDSIRFTYVDKLAGFRQ